LFVVWYSGLLFAMVGHPSSGLISAEIKTINWCSQVNSFGDNCFIAQKMLHFMGEHLGAAKQRESMLL